MPRRHYNSTLLQNSNLLEIAKINNFFVLLAYQIFFQALMQGANSESGKTGVMGKKTESKKH
jgi:hypothetical protein